MKGKIALLCVLLFAVSLSAFAANPPIPKFTGSWNITGYLEPGLTSPYTYCFDFTNTGGVLGFTNSGTWNVPSYSAGWSGEWYVNGDEIIIHGVAAGDFIFSWKGSIQNAQKIAGRQVEFFITGATDTAGTFSGTKISGSCPAAVSKGGDPAK
ncbi:MAG TPA: hypothetical protein VMH04_12790 [Candidatus Solibacter sp.]|nr:hypothetical protein [Candidatus Solibacter sp.]